MEAPAWIKSGDVANAVAIRDSSCGPSASAAKTVNITITGGGTNPTPSLKVVNRDVYDVVTSSTGYRSLGVKVGTIALGKPCQSNYKVYSSHYRVTRSDVTITRTPRSNSVVARCAIS